MLSTTILFGRNWNFYRWEKLGPEKLSNSPKLTQPINGPIQTQAFTAQHTAHPGMGVTFTVCKFLQQPKNALTPFAFGTTQLPLSQSLLLPGDPGGNTAGKSSGGGRLLCDREQGSSPSARGAGDRQAEAARVRELW